LLQSTAVLYGELRDKTKLQCYRNTCQFAVSRQTSAGWQMLLQSHKLCQLSCLRITVVERRSLAGELSLSCARPVVDGWPLMWVNRPLQVSHLGQLSLSSFQGR